MPGCVARAGAVGLNVEQAVPDGCAECHATRHFPACPGIVPQPRCPIRAPSFSSGPFVAPVALHARCAQVAGLVV
eukprot:4711576-Lingulodinium_polyedra.AAC.1